MFRNSTCRATGGALPRRVALLFVVMALAGSIGASAATILLHQDAATSLVAQRLFTTGGKRVLSGSLASCTSVVLEEPAIAFRERRLFLRVHLAARAGVRLNNNCVGGGQAFYTTVSGQPYADGENVGIRDVRLDEGKPEYRQLLEPLLQQSLPSLLGRNLREELNKAFQSQSGGLRLALTQFRLQDVTAADGLLTVQFDFVLRADKP